MNSYHIQLADSMVKESLKLQPGELVFLEAWEGVPREMVAALIEAVHVAGGRINYHLRDQRLHRAMLVGAQEGEFRTMARAELTQIRDANAFISFGGQENPMELRGVSDGKIRLHREEYFGTLREHVNSMRRLMAHWPTAALAEHAGVPPDRFVEQYFKAALLDYGKMAAAAQPLVELMAKTDRVELIGPETSLALSIRGMGATGEFGERNRPGGEVYSTPIPNSVEGTIVFNTKFIDHGGGDAFEGISFHFERGRIVRADCTTGDPSRLNHLLDTDEGSRFLGEVALGLNPHVSQTVGVPIFDEKIARSIHVAIGFALNGKNGNRSSIHRDFVQLHTPKQPGETYEVRFDGDLIRKNGSFVPECLQGLNPEHLS